MRVSRYYALIKVFLWYNSGFLFNFLEGKNKNDEKCEKNMEKFRKNVYIFRKLLLLLLNTQVKLDDTVADQKPLCEIFFFDPLL